MHGPQRHFAQDGGVYLGVFYDATTSYLLSRRLKLGLDQGDNMAAVLQMGQRRRYHQGQGDKGNVDDHQVHRLGQFVRVASVGLFHDRNPRILAQLVVQLAVSHVHGVNVACPPLQEAVGKSAGGCAHVQSRLAGHVQGKGVQRPGQLQSAPADVGQPAPYFQRGVRGQ